MTRGEVEAKPEEDDEVTSPSSANPRYESTSVATKQVAGDGPPEAALPGVSATEEGTTGRTDRVEPHAVDGLGEVWASWRTWTVARVC